MKYFLGEVTLPNNKIEYRLIEAEDLLIANEKLQYVYGSYAKHHKVLTTL